MRQASASALSYFRACRRHLRSWWTYLASIRRRAHTLEALAAIHERLQSIGGRMELRGVKPEVAESIEKAGLGARLEATGQPAGSQ